MFSLSATLFFAASFMMLKVRGRNGANELSDFDKGRIVQLKSMNKTFVEIATAVNRDASTVRKFWIRYNQNLAAGQNSTQTENRGRNRKTSVQTDRQIRRAICMDPFLTIKELKEVVPQ